MFVKENPDRKEKKIVLTQIGLFQKNKTIMGGRRERGGGGRVEDMECPGVYQRKSMWKFQGFIKNEVEFPRVTKEI